MKKITLIVAVVTAIGLSGCKKYLNETVNPNAPSQTTIQLSLTGAEKVLADNPNELYGNYAYWMGLYGVSSGYIVQPNLSEYVLTTNDFQTWNNLYANLSNIVNVENLAIAAKEPDYQAIAMVMRAYDFEQLVDQYNDVPYSQAFNSSILFPAYDKGPAIYADLIKQMDAAIALIAANTSEQAPGSEDIIFGGNMTGWAKFANTLKLRLILRQTGLSSFSSIATDINTTVGTGYLDGTTQALAQPGYTLNDAYGGQESPFWHAYGTNQNGNPENSLVKANTYFIKLLHGYNDPRLVTAYQNLDTSPDTLVRGLYLGDPTLSADSNSGSTLSNVGPGLLQSAAQPGIVFSGAESLFLQAEAVQRGVLTPPAGVTAESLYEAGITASFEAQGASYQVNTGTAKVPVYINLPVDESAADYYTQPIVNVNWKASVANPLEAIAYQKYFALIGPGNFEVYNEWRRTGYPNVPVTLDPAAAGPIPRRILYPQVEYDTNAANIKAEGTISPFTSRIFWDTRP